MGPELLFGLVMLVFLGLLLLGMAIPFAIASTGLLYLWLEGGRGALNGLGLISWGSMNNFTLTALPLFILMAEILRHSGLSGRIYNGLSQIVTPIPGGLLQTNIVGSAFFSAISGSSLATSAAIGSVAVPQLEQRNYDRRLSLGSLAAGGTLGVLIPPSVGMIIYGSFTDVSVAKLFMAGIGPGLLVTLLFSGYIAFRALRNPVLAPRERIDRFDALRLAGEIGPFILLIGTTLGSIYFGYATPTEAAGAGCVFSLAIAALFRRLSPSMIWKALRDTVLSVGALLFIVYAAFIFSYAISYAGIGELLTERLLGLGLSPFGFMVAVFLLYIVLGCLIESIGIIVITVPLLFPIVVQYGFDPIWFGIIVVMFVELGQVTPPVGLNLFVIHSIAGGKLSDVLLGALPFVALLLVAIVIVALFPDIALWLPGQMF